MLLNLKKYYRPRSLEGVFQRLNANPCGCFILAGGTYLNASARRDVEEVVDISSLKLKDIKQSELMIHIGSAVTLQAIIDNSKLPPRRADGVLAQACQSNSVSRMIRNQRTLGGEVVAGARYSDVAAVLLALDARIKVRRSNQEESRIPMEALWNSHAVAGGQGHANPHGLILEFIIPKPARSCAATFERIVQIESQPSFLSAAAVLEFSSDNTCAAARVVLGAYAAVPMRLKNLEAQLRGQRLSPALIDRAASSFVAEMNPLDDVRASAAYRQTVASRLIRRVLHGCLEGKS